MFEAFETFGAFGSYSFSDAEHSERFERPERPERQDRSLHVQPERFLQDDRGRGGWCGGRFTAIPKFACVANDVRATNEERHREREAIHREIRGSDVVILPNVAHMLQCEDPPAFHKPVLEFLAKHAA